MQAKSRRLFDGSAHLKNIPTNSSGVGIVSAGYFFFRILEMIDVGKPLALEVSVACLISFFDLDSVRNKFFSLLNFVLRSLSSTSLNNGHFFL